MWLANWLHKRSMHCPSVWKHRFSYLCRDCRYVIDSPFLLCQYRTTLSRLRAHRPRRLDTESSDGFELCSGCVHAGQNLVHATTTNDWPVEAITSSGCVILALQPLNNPCRKFPVVADESNYYNMHPKCTESNIQSRASIYDL
jgi:hypothetical protein